MATPKRRSVGPSVRSGTPVHGSAYCVTVRELWSRTLRILPWCEMFTPPKVPIEPGGNSRVCVRTGWSRWRIREAVAARIGVRVLESDVRVIHVVRSVGIEIARAAERDTGEVKRVDRRLRRRLARVPIFDAAAVDAVAVVVGIARKVVRQADEHVRCALGLVHRAAKE